MRRTDSRMWHMHYGDKRTSLYHKPCKESALFLVCCFSHTVSYMCSHRDMYVSIYIRFTVNLRWLLGEEVWRGCEELTTVTCCWSSCSLWWVSVRPPCTITILAASKYKLLSMTAVYRRWSIYIALSLCVPHQGDVTWSIMHGIPMPS